MRPIATIVLAFAACATVAVAQAKDAIAVSLAPTAIDVHLGEPVTVNIAVTNVSSTPQYLDRNVIGPLEYSIKSAAGRVLCGISDPPPPPPKPQSEEDWVWLQPGEAMRFTQRLSQKDLCMSAPGAYYVYAFLTGQIATEAQRKSHTLDFFFSWSKPIRVVVQPQ